MRTKFKVVIKTDYSTIEQTVKDKAEALRFKDSIEVGRKIQFFSISEVTINNK